MAKGTCSIDGCTNTHQARGWCAAHYQRWRYSGTTDGPPVSTARCKIDGCTDDHFARGWCRVHFDRWKRSGTTDPPERPTECAVTGCEGSVKGWGWCEKHYQRWWKHGDPFVSLTVPLPFPENLLRRLALKPNGCVEYNGGDNGVGYGKVNRDGRSVYAHRAMWELMVGPIPEGLELDHLCRNPPCVNVGHLEPVTHAENMRRAAAARTHCPHGHEYDRLTNGRRWCSRCRVAERQRAKAKKRAAAR